MSFCTINPTTEEILMEYNELTNSEIDSIIHQSHKCFNSWKTTSFLERSLLMNKAAQILRNRKEEYAKLMALEMGKPYLQGISEIEKCAWVCDYYAENAQEQLSDFSIATEMNKSYISYQPIGTVLAIMPWNFPFWQVFRFAAPALMAGNVGLLKHSRNTMGCAIQIENVFKEAGFPEYCFKNLVIGSEPVANIIRHKLIAAVTLTGSSPVGQKVASVAGSCIKKTVLELGGSDPYIILEDANLSKAAEICTNARLINSGQSCIAAKRFIVVEKVYNDFIDLFVKNMSKAIMGNPLDTNVNIGPQARKDLQLDLDRQTKETQKLGGKLLLGGELPSGIGYFYPATVMIDINKEMPYYNEETFGPLAAIIKANTEQEAIELANDTIFGLGAAVFTEDLERGNYIARNSINSGACFVNGFVKSDPRLPFGGVKQSGYGRELSMLGIREFVNIKTVCIA